MKIKTKIKKVLQENCGEGFVFIEILKNEIEIMDFNSLLSIKIPLSELDFYDEIKNIDFEKNLNSYDKTVLGAICDKFEKLDLSKILIKKIKFYYDFGFHYDNYAEFFYHESQLAETLETPLKEFEFGEYKVKIGEASGVFKLIFSELSGDKRFGDWEYYQTIKIRDNRKKVLAENEVDKFLQMALYFINRYSPTQKAEVIKLDLYGDEVEIEESQNFKNISEIKYKEPLIFYAEGLKHGDNEISFLYFYKVLEYFFLINRKEEYENLISEYNKSSESDKTDEFIKKVSSIHTTKEKDNLKRLLSNPLYQPKIQDLADIAYNKKIITQNSTGKLLNDLYYFRNSIVHGKFGDKIELTLPKIINQNRITTRNWIKITRELAEIIIDNFCFKYHD